GQNNQNQGSGQGNQNQGSGQNNQNQGSGQGNQNQGSGQNNQNQGSGQGNQNQGSGQNNQSGSWQSGGGDWQSGGGDNSWQSGGGDNWQSDGGDWQSGGGNHNDSRRYRGRVTASELLLRSAPTRASQVIRVAHRGEIVSIFCKTPGQNVQGNSLWYLLTDGTWAWGSARYIDTIGTAPRWC
ncbi:SH3 domain-containing protein, partial [Streptomyces sp. NPDC002962]|uniref:SH3 domain-containing protein n=1 Tax=Streptomyces sp. NPDC002962 TaxID=3364674 RepID=UPI00367B0EF8